jgi:hypothetical protein
MADEALGFLTLYELAECMHTRQVSPPENSSGHPSVTRQRYRLPQPACGPCRIATQQDMARHCERAVAAGGGKPEASGGSGGAKIPFGLPILSRPSMSPTLRALCWCHGVHEVAHERARSHNLVDFPVNQTEPTMARGRERVSCGDLFGLAAGVRSDEVDANPASLGRGLGPRHQDGARIVLRFHPG